MKNVLILFALISGSITAQNLEKHRWKHRLLLIFTSELNSTEVEEQLQLLKAAEKDLAERKVKIYVISEEAFRKGFSSENHFVEEAKKISKPFEIVLIGLDGGEKFRSGKVQPAQTFNDIIDQMPMRRQELRGKNKK